jgi:hypothetical protein
MPGVIRSKPKERNGAQGQDRTADTGIFSFRGSSSDLFQAFPNLLFHFHVAGLFAKIPWSVDLEHFENFPVQLHRKYTSGLEPTSPKTSRASGGVG